MEKEDKLYKILLTLGGKKKYVVELLYGLNNNEKMNPYEISQRLNVDESYVYFVIDDIESRLEENDEDIKEDFGVQLSSKKADRGFQLPKIDDNIEKLIERMSETFFNMFPNKRPVDVENYMNNLPSKDRDIVFLYYGLDGIHCLDYDEIAQKYKITIDEVDRIIERSLVKLNKILVKNSKHNKENTETYSNIRDKYNFLVKKYGKEEVYVALENLSEKDKNIIIEYCERNVSYRAIGEIYNVSANSIYSIINNRLKKIENILENRDDYYGFYKKFEGYTKKDVHEAMNKLTYMEQEVLILAFGLNGKNRISNQTIAQKYDFAISDINVLVENLLNRLQNILKGMESSKNDNESNVYLDISPSIVEMCEKIENDYSILISKYSSSALRKIILNLDSNDQILFKTYFGFECDRKSLKAISKLYALSYLEILKNIDYILIEIKCLMDEFDERKKEFLDEIKDKRKLKIINKILNSRELLLLAFYYGVNGQDMIAVKELSRKFNMDEEIVRGAIKEIVLKINNYTEIKRK